TMPDSSALRNRFGASDKVADARIDFVAEAAAIEDAVMPGTWLHVEFFQVLRDVGAQAMRRLSLTDAGNVALLAFDRHKRDVGNGGGIDLAAIVDQLALGQGEFLEDQIDGLQLELFGHVQYGQIV